MIFSGTIFAIIAMLGWTFGDFYIHKATREIGIWQSMFWIGLMTSVCLAPFVYDDIRLAIHSPHILWTLIGASVVGMLAAYSNFAAWKKGKFAIIQPVLGLEGVATAILGFFFFHELLTTGQIVLVVATFAGLILTSLTKRWKNDWRSPGVEHGVALGLLGALFLSATNVMTALTGRMTNPLFAIWFIHTVSCVCTFFAILFDTGITRMVRTAKKHIQHIVVISILDNIAWISFTIALTKIPVAVATTIGLGYVPLGSLLGVFVNHERVSMRQRFGIALILLSIFAFGYFT